MKDIKYVRDDFQFIYRVSAIIYNKNRSKVLLCNTEGRKFYMLLGGKIRELEKSEDAIRREVLEELGWSNIDFTFCGISEDYVFDKNLHNHQLEIIYEGIYKDDITETKFKGLEGDWINFLWIDIANIDKYNIYPTGVKDIIRSPGEVKHITEWLYNNRCE